MLPGHRRARGAGRRRARCAAACQRVRATSRGRLTRRSASPSAAPATETRGALLRAATRALLRRQAARPRPLRRLPRRDARALLGALDDGDGARGEQLAAAMLLAETLDLRDVGTARHSADRRPLRGADRRARSGCADGRVERMRVAGVLHDIGKLGVADAVLQKPGALTDEEWEEMRRHAELGARILAHANLPDIASWVLAHHERLDGGGYPHGLAGDAIPLEARILAVADAYEAMTADRAIPRRARADEAREPSCAAAPARSSTPPWSRRSCASSR